MAITQALIIDEPWIGKLLAGEKTWEMRSSSTSKRGQVGLIAKGSGTVVGVAELVGSHGPLDREAMRSSYDKHGIPVDMIESGAVDKWCYAWQLENVRRLEGPVAYQHRPGAVIWVNLDDAAKGALNGEQEAGATWPRRLEYEWVVNDQSADAGQEPAAAPAKVPVARDGSRFGPHLARGGVFTVGAKGEERRFDNYEAALEYLRGMSTARWRRPNSNGNWGIVSATGWEL